MIFLGVKEEPVVSIDSDLVLNYKHEGDMCLVNIQHELTKQLISYKVYYHLQQVDNAFFKIIDNLLKDKYTDDKQIQDDYGDFVKMCNVFLKNCESIEYENVYKNVLVSIDNLKLNIQKLIYIVQNICSVRKE